jgi:hypothetical protein
MVFSNGKTICGLYHGDGLQLAIENMEGYTYMGVNCAVLCFILNAYRTDYHIGVQMWFSQFLTASFKIPKYFEDYYSCEFFLSTRFADFRQNVCNGTNI